MRIIGYIEHPHLKISVFKLTHRYAVKFESGLYEQTFKFRESEQINGLAALQNLVDQAFLSKVENTFVTMHQTKMEAVNRNNPVMDRNEFDTII